MRRELIAIAVLAMTAVSSFAADRQPGPMAEMMADPSHLLMMGYHKNVIAFGRVLVTAARQGETVPGSVARPAIAEMRRSVEEMERYRSKLRSQGIGVEMQKMMDEHLVEIKSHLRQLEELAKSDRIPSREVLGHLQFLSRGCGARGGGRMYCADQGKGITGACRDGMTPERRRMMDGIIQKMKAEDAELATEVEKMKRAPKERKTELLSDIVARLVKQRADLTDHMEKMRMQMMHGAPCMHRGGAWMAPPPGIGGMDGEDADEGEDENGE